MKAIGFVGDSGSGKTTLIERLLARFAPTGMRLAAVKHAHHGFDIDRPGKDSYRFRAAGASQVLLASSQRWALLCDEKEHEGDPTATLAQQLGRLGPCDLVFVEGFRGQAGIPFIEVQRRGLVDSSEARKPTRGPVAGAVALATDDSAWAQQQGRTIPIFALDDIDAIAGFVAQQLELSPC